MHWIFWTGAGLFIAGIISMAITLAGQGPPSFIEETFGYSLVWSIVGMAMMIVGVIKNALKK